MAKKVNDEVYEDISETSENKVEKKKKEDIEPAKPSPPAPPKPYIHVDTFLKTAVPLFSLTKMQAAGFKMRMSGKAYQRDEQVFMKELKDYLNLK